MGSNSAIQYIVCGDGDHPALQVEVGSGEGEPSSGAQTCFQIDERLIGGSTSTTRGDDQQVVFTFPSLRMFQSRNFAVVAVDQMLDCPMMGYGPYRRQISEVLFKNVWRVPRPYELERVGVAFSTVAGPVRMPIPRMSRRIRLTAVDDGASGGASRDFVKRLERVRFEKDPRFSAGRFGVESCAVCQDDYVDGTRVVSLPCLHVFHDKCLRRWLDKSNACPLCRYQMPIET